VGPHHAKGLLDDQVKCAVHAPRDVPAEGMQAMLTQNPHPAPSKQQAEQS
jgi:hypothetical protein